MQPAKNPVGAALELARGSYEAICSPLRDQWTHDPQARSPRVLVDIEPLVEIVHTQQLARQLLVDGALEAIDSDPRCDVEQRLRPTGHAQPVDRHQSWGLVPMHHRDRALGVPGGRYDDLGFAGREPTEPEKVCGGEAADRCVGCAQHRSPALPVEASRVRGQGINARTQPDVQAHPESRQDHVIRSAYSDCLVVAEAAALSSSDPLDLSVKVVVVHDRRSCRRGMTSNPRAATIVC